VFNEDVTVDFNANVGPYTSSLGQALAMTNQFSAANDIAIAKLGNLNKISLSLIQSTAAFTGANKVAVAQAAAYEQKLSSLNATAKIAGKQFEGLGSVTMKFARQFPVGMDKAIETTKTLATSGVTTTKQIQKLGQEFIKLQAASGEWGSGMQQDMLQVTRSFGNSTNMIKGFSDSLVSVTAKYGASASSVLAFSKAIAPIASVVGISQASVFGLSTAMSRLGEDGYRSANAFNKVLLDMNRSIRTGSPEIREYAKVLNMSTDSLGNLFKSDPTEMILRFTDAINKQGSQAVTTLDNLGLDGVNTFKSLQALSKSGDLRQIVGDATSSYNNGSANAGATSALGGVNDQLSKMQETMSQTTAEAGKPFLSFLNSVLGVSNGMAEGVHGLVTALSGLGPLLPVLTSLWTILKGIAVIQLGRLGLSMFTNSNFGQQFFAGRTQAINGQAFGPNALSTAGARVGQAFGTLFGGKDPVTGARGGPIGMLKGGAQWIAQAYTNANANLYNADPSNSRMRTDAGMAASNNKFMLKNGGTIMSAEEQAIRYGRDSNNVIRPATMATMPNAIASQLAMQMGAYGSPNGEYGASQRLAVQKAMFNDMRQTSGTLGFFKDAVKYAGKNVGEFGKSMGTRVKDWVKQGAITGVSEEGTAIRGGQRFGALGGALSGMMGMLGSTIGIMAVMAAAGFVSKAIKQNNERQTGTGFSDAYSVYNDFATKAGLPTQSYTNTNAMYDPMAWASYYAKSAKSPRQATKMSTSEILNALKTDYKASYTFNTQKELLTGTGLGIQARMMAGPNASPEVISRLTQDALAGTKNATLARAAGNYATGKSTYGSSNSGLYTDAFQSAADTMTYTDAVAHRQSAYGGTMAQLIRQEATSNINNTALKFGTGTIRMATLSEAVKILRGTAGISGSKGYRDVQNMNAARIVSELLGVKYDLNSWNLLKQQRVNSAVSQSTSDTDPLSVFFANTSDKKSLPSNSFYQYYKTLIKGGGYGWETPYYVKGKRQVSPEETYAKKQNSQLGGALFAAEDFAWSKSKTVLDIYNDPTVFNGIKNKIVKLAINAFVAQNDVGSQNSFSQAISTMSLTANAENGANAVIDLLKELANPNLAATSSQAAAIMNAYSMTAASRSVQQAGQSGLANINENIKTGVKAANTVLPTGATQDEQSILNQEKSNGQQAVSQVMSFAKQIANLNHSLAESQNDMNLNITRSQAKFTLGILRGTQDFAKSYYNVYERIGGQRVASTGALVTNLKEQNTLLNRQMKNVAKLKKLGLSDDAIRTLDLMNPANAQQTDQLVNDMTRNAALVSQTNETVSKRIGLSNQHETSPFNTAYARAKEDFNLQMQYMNEDFEKAAKRAYNDLFNFGENVAIGGKGATDKLAKALSGMPDVAGKAAKAAGQAILANLKSSLGGLTGSEQFSLVNGILNAPKKAPNAVSAPNSGSSGSGYLAGGSGSTSPTGSANRNAASTIGKNTGVGTRIGGVQSQSSTPDTVWGAGVPVFGTGKNRTEVWAASNDLIHYDKHYDAASKKWVWNATDTASGKKLTTARKLEVNASSKRAQFLEAAFQQIGKPYKTGGWHYTDHDGHDFDCSGLVDYAAHAAGVKDLGYSTAQGIKNKVAKIDSKNAKAGDLVFWTKNGSNEAHHVAIFIGNGMVLDAQKSGTNVHVQGLNDFKNDGNESWGRIKGFATGGYITGPGTGTSDSIPAKLSHGEFVVKADAVNKYGIDLLHALNDQKLGSPGYVKHSDVRASRMNHYSTQTYNVSHSQYDQSTQINGPITVQSSDPAEFARKMNARQRRQRLLQPVGN